METTLTKIAVLGAGKMGAGIAQFFATKGYDVTVINVFDDRTRDAAQPTIRSSLEVLCESGVLTVDQIPAILSRIRFVDAMEEAVGADIVFECIIEELEAKQEYFRLMDALFPPETVLASNTSAISITEIGAKARNRERILGTHFWDPPYIIPLVEVIRTEHTAQWALDRVFDLLNSAHKKPVFVKKDVPGFLANRMQHALFREALSIVEKGIASAQDVDDSIKYGFGMRLSISPPIEVMDRGGLDLTYNIHKYLFPHLEDSKEPLPILCDKVQEQRLGAKTGEGILVWDEEKVQETNKNLVSGLIKIASALDRL